MPQSTLDKQIRKAVRSAARHNFTARMDEVFKHYRERAHTRTDGDIRTTNLALSIRGGVTCFSLTVGLLGSSQQSQVTAEVTYGGKRMLYLVRYSAGIQPLSSSMIDPRLIVRRKDGGMLVVYEFLPGCWMEGLNLKQLIRQEQRLERQRQKELERAARPANAIPPREDDYRIGKRFGLN